MAKIIGRFNHLSHFIANVRAISADILLSVF